MGIEEKLSCNFSCLQSSRLVSQEPKFFLNNDFTLLFSWKVRAGTAVGATTTAVTAILKAGSGGVDEDADEDGGDVDDG